MNRKQRRSKLDEIRLVADSLRAEPIDAPDFTASILDRVDAQRAFLAPSVRRTIPWVRLGVLGGVATLALSAVLVLRYAPESVQLVDRPAPLSAVVSSVERNADAPLQALRQNVQDTVRSVTAAEPARVLSAVAAAATALPEPAPAPLVAPLAAEPVAAMSLAGGAGEPAFAGPPIASPPLAAPASRGELVLTAAPVTASLAAPARALLTGDALLRPRLESSVVPLPQRAPLPGLLDASLDELPVVK